MGIDHSGGRTWIYTDDGLFCNHLGETQAVLGAEALKLSGSKGPNIICVHPSGGHLVDGEGQLLAFDLKGEVTPISRRVVAMETLDEQRWAVAVRESRHVVVRVGQRGGENVRLRTPATLPQTSVPSLRWTGDSEPFTRRKRISENRASLRLRSLDGALAMSDSDSGIVALWRRGSDWCASFRFPCADGSWVDAFPWPGGGLLVAIRSDLGDGALLRVSADGELADSLPVQELGSCVSDGTSVLFTAANQLFRWVPGETAESLLPCHPGLENAYLATAAEDCLACETADVLHWVEPSSGQSGPWRIRPFEPPATPAPPMVIAKIELPRKRKDAPQIVLDGAHEPMRWDVCSGPCQLVFHLMMTGGPASGLLIELGGPGARLFVVERAELSGGANVIAPFSGQRVVLDCDLAAGVEIPNPPKSVARKKSDAKAWRWAQHPDDCRLTLTLVGKAPADGTALCTVRISFVEHGRRGSLLRGQTFRVGPPLPPPEPDPIEGVGGAATSAATGAATGAPSGSATEPASQQQSPGE